MPDPARALIPVVSPAVSSLARFATAPKPTGGFLWLPVPFLLSAWLAYQDNHMTALALRGLLGCLEMIARRCQREPHHTAAQYGPDELARLLDVRVSQARTVVTHLEDAGFLTWTPDHLTLLGMPQHVPRLDQAAYAARRATLPYDLHRVPLPRRMARWLAAQASPGLIGVVFGVSLRCLRYTQGTCRFGGSVPLEALRQSLGLQERTTRRQLRLLEGVGWLTPVQTSPWHVQRYGRWYRPALDWEAPAEAAAGAPPRRRHGSSPQQLPLALPVPAEEMSAPAPALPAPPVSLAPVPPLPPPAPPEEMPCATVPHEALSLPAPEAAWPAEAAADLAPPPAAPAVEPHTPEEWDALARASLRARGLYEDFLVTPLIRDEIARLQLPPPDAPASAPTEVPLPAPGCTKLSAPSDIKLSAPLALSSKNKTTCVPSSLKPLREKPQEQPANTPGIQQDEENKSTEDTVPTWKQVTLEDLHDLSRLEVLYDQAIAWDWFDRSPASWLACVTAAIHAAQRGHEPGALFRYVLSHKAWEVLTNSEEDAARAWLRRQRGESVQAAEAPGGAHEALSPTLPVDVQFVQDVQRRLRAQGWAGDPWLLVKQHSPDWTRARWLAAVDALEHWQLVQVQAQVAWRASQATAVEDAALDEDDEGGEDEDW